MKGQDLHSINFGLGELVIVAPFTVHGPMPVFGGGWFCLTLRILLKSGVRGLRRSLTCQSRLFVRRWTRNDSSKIANGPGAKLVPWALVFSYSWVAVEHWTGS